MNTKLFLVFKWDIELTNYEFQGVFSTEELAIESCLNEYYFIGPAILDENLPEETTEWVDAYFPKSIN